MAKKQNETKFTFTVWNGYYDRDEEYEVELETNRETLYNVVEGKFDDHHLGGLFDRLFENDYSDEAPYKLTDKEMLERVVWAMENLF